jgi:hypothetical protein
MFDPPDANTVVRRAVDLGSASAIDDALSRLEAVTLAELDTAQLHDRVESKVVMRTDDVAATLLRLHEDYLVMDHENRRIQRYSNTYFDTADLTNYHQHHNQKRCRSKVRYRQYVDSDLTFFEIKRNVSGRTLKERQGSVPAGTTVWPGDVPFLTERVPADPDQLSVSLSIEYDRILLVSRDFSERVTIDINPRFRSRGATGEMAGLAIVEFKQPRFDRYSPAMQAIPQRRQMFSKYCMAIATCDPTLKQNRFKKVFLGLDKLGVSARCTSKAVA